MELMIVIVLDQISIILSTQIKLNVSSSKMGESSSSAWTAVSTQPQNQLGWKKLKINQAYVLNFLQDYNQPVGPGDYLRLRPFNQRIIKIVDTLNQYLKISP